MTSISRASRSTSACTTKGMTFRLLPEPRVETVTAARFVGALGAYEHAFAARNKALGVVGRRTADHADSERLGDVFGNREQLGHGFEGFAQVVLIEARDDDALALVRERAADRGEFGVEELSFVDADDLCLRQDLIQQLAR